MIFFSLVEYPDLGVVGWVLGNKLEDGFGCGGWWVLFLDESPDLRILFSVTKGRMCLGEQSRGGVKRVGWECYVMKWGVESLIWGVLSNGVCRDIKEV